VVGDADMPVVEGAQETQVGLPGNSSQHQSLLRLRLNYSCHEVRPWMPGARCASKGLGVGELPTNHILTVGSGATRSGAIVRGPSSLRRVALRCLHSRQV